MLYSWSTELIQVFSWPSHILADLCVGLFLLWRWSQYPFPKRFQPLMSRLRHCVEDHILSCDVLRFDENKRVLLNLTVGLKTDVISGMYRREVSSRSFPVTQKQCKPVDFSRSALFRGFTQRWTPKGRRSQRRGGNLKLSTVNFCAALKINNEFISHAGKRTCPGYLSTRVSWATNTCARLWSR
jgi:hypothetical protein